jgi:putative membrane protein
MIIIATLVVALAAALHVGIFIMESVAWTRPAIWKRFGVADQAAAETTKPLAYNQGFYNLFLAIGAIIGVVLFAAGLTGAGLALVILSLGSMLAASIVLLTTGRGYIRAALTQGILPLAGLVLILLAR